LIDCIDQIVYAQTTSHVNWRLIMQLFGLNSPV